MNTGVPVRAGTRSLGFAPSKGNEGMWQSSQSVRLHLEGLEDRALMSVSPLGHVAAVQPDLHIASHHHLLPNHHQSFAVAPSPIRPGSWVELNPQPLPPKEQEIAQNLFLPGSWVELNPQPLPPKEAAVIS
jgi:hypothetical protein